ncbi:hypothetical protein [Legionella israelensis]|uniref:Integral membrane protein (PIN domain superfamily) n=1 Tax=Legionella israelensis TaxID=454 RepID=A0A0W0WMW4_9GAMM|nr:hypothetical protein [Legionella israelensis]KTD33631.1 Integral membrane protein (PIN domain superfamily) [Legionella israelensis]QBS08788.1 hypothetical protein E4T55_02280 [Legionella israelensis]SCY12360.1 hypothetical protein SAMN02746069_01363 [Legionella israelensis DSM 19235]STX58465.1 Integral membrane protein (PIN domain superfamily) [Legionella israelensis]
MLMSIFLAKVIGWYCVIVGLFVLFRQREMLTIMSDVLNQRALLFFIALVTLILGLLMVISHNIWVMAWPVIITIIAWIVLIGGIIRLLITPALAYKIGNWWLKRPHYLTIAALIYIILGLYLLLKGYMFVIW